MPDPIRHIATYARVSSDEQRDRHTVRNQRAALSRRLGSEPDVLVFKHYEDDGVSGTIPFEDRPAGRALARDARAGRFSQVWVVRSDRLGRDAFELLRIWRVFESIGISLRATDENIDDPFYFDIHAVIAANERRKFLERSAEGMNRAAKEGRYTGGIVPLGYSVSGDRGFRRLVPDDSPMWAGLSAADIVRRIYDHLAVDGWSCVRIATEFNSLGVPTSYRRDGRGVRGKRTQGLWRSGRIRNLVVNPVYRGLLQYGRRSTKPNGREVISASVSPLVSEDVWNAAIATLKRNRALPRNSCHSYLLRSLIRCAVCGLSFCGTWTRGPRYRCNGSMAHRGPFAGKCIGASIKGEKLEAAVWSDVSRFLTDPDELTDELLAESNDIESRAVAEAERDSLLANRSAVQDRRTRAIDLYTRGKLSEVEFDAIAADVERELKTLDDRLAVLEPDDDVADDGLSEHVLTEIRQRLTGDLSDSERREIVQLLVRRITVHTTLTGRGPKQVRVVIDYRFPPGGAARTRARVDCTPARSAPVTSASSPCRATGRPPPTWPTRQRAAHRARQSVRPPPTLRAMTANDDSIAGFRVFLSGVIQGSHQDAAHHDQSYRDRLRELLKAAHPDVEVVCPVELNPNSAGYEHDAARETFFEELELAASADVTIAFVPVATMGTAVEMYRAFDAGQLVFTISPMAQNWAVRHLSSRVFPDLATFEAFVRAGEVGKALAARRADVRP